jgi:peroxiredoxin
MRTALVSLAAGLLFAPAAFAQVEPEAKQALDKLIETISTAKTISYHTDVKGEGRWFSMLPTTKGDVVAARPDENTTAWKMRITGRSEGVGIDPMNILVVADPTKWAWVDDANRQVVERFNGQERGNVIDAANAIRIREMFEAHPLSKEVKCDVIKKEPSVDIDGVKCDVVYVDQGKDLPKGRWFIATTDHLPRKVEQIIQGGGLDDKRVWTMSNVKLNAEPPAGSFGISTPDGYTYSPAAQPVPPSGQTQTQAIPMTPPKRERAVGPNLDELAPDFDLVSSTGEHVKLSSLKGQVVVLDFWGTWNLTAKKTTAVVQGLANKYQGKPVKIFGMSVREGTDATPTKFFKDNNLSYPLLLKADESAKAYHIKKYPTIFVIGKEGEVVYMLGGYDDKYSKDIEAKIDQALAGGDKEKATEVQPPGDNRTKGVPDTKPKSDDK